jgi:hypothetical protein
MPSRIWQVRLVGYSLFVFRATNGVQVLVIILHINWELSVTPPAPRHAEEREARAADARHAALVERQLRERTAVLEEAVARLQYGMWAGSDRRAAWAMSARAAWC